jgi:hypothetical protein
LKIIEGFKAAKELLSRQAPTEFYPVSPVLRQSLQEMFGVDEPEVAVSKL